MTQSVFLSDMTWMEFEARVKSDPPIVIVPVGSTEQHGPHLPLSTDVILPEGVATRVAQQIDALVAPAVPYGYKSQPKTGGGNHFPGTISLDASTLIATLRDVVNGLVQHGVRKIVLFNGHMENDWFIVEAIDLALRDQRREGVDDLRIVKIGYWDFINAETEAFLFPDGLLSWALEHAAVLETSLMMQFRPDLVRVDRIIDHPPAAFPPYDVYPFDTGPIPVHGVLSSAMSASPEKGRRVLDQIVPEIAAALSSVFA